MAELFTGIVDIKTWTEREKLNFDIYDKDKNGYLEGKELMEFATSSFKRWAKETNWYGGKKHSEQEINARFEEELKQILMVNDKNRDGKINFQEYTEMMRNILILIHGASVEKVSGN